MAHTDDVAPSGNEAFDRARDLPRAFREDEALDWFEIAAEPPTTPRSAARRPRSSPASSWLAAGRGRSEVWAEHRPRERAPPRPRRPPRGGRPPAARRGRRGPHAAGERRRPDRPLVPGSVTAARIARAHVMYLDGDVDAATAEVLATFEADPFAPDVWDAFARLCAETDFDPTEFVARVPDDHVLEVMAVAAGVGAGGRRPHRGADLGAPPGRSARARARAVVRGEAREHARDGVVGAHPRGRHGPAVPAARPRRGRRRSTRPSGCARRRSPTRRSATAAPGPR